MPTISSGEKSDSRDVKHGYCKILKNCRLITCYLSATIEKNKSAGCLELRLNEDGGSEGNNVFKSFDLSRACNVVVTCDKENLSISNKVDVVWMIMKSFEESVDWGHFLCSNMSSIGPIIKNSSNSAKNSATLINSNISSNNSVSVSNIFQPRPPQDVASSKIIASPRGKSTIASARNRGLSEGEVNLSGSSIAESPLISNPIAESGFRSPVSNEANHLHLSSYVNEKSQIFISIRKKGGSFKENNSLHSNQVPSVCL